MRTSLIVAADFFSDGDALRRFNAPERAGVNVAQRLYCTVCRILACGGLLPPTLADK